MNTAERQVLWNRLRAAGLVDGDTPPDAAAQSPWFVRVMLGVAGWIGALFLLAFAGVGFDFVTESATASFVTGAGACAAAVALLRAAARSEFLSQFGLAVSLAGQLLIAFALVRWLDDHAGLAALAIVLQQSALFALAPNFIHRIWTALTATIAFLYTLVSVDLHAFVPAAVTFAFLFSWLAEFEAPRHGERLRAAGYGIALATALVAIGYASFATGRRIAPDDPGAFGTAAFWLGHLALGFTLLWAVLRLLKREHIGAATGSGRGALAAAVVLAVIAVEVPGLAPAAAILVTGFANGNRLLAALGIIALLGCLGHYYHALHATLLAKSALLVGTGMTLLAVRFALQRAWSTATGTPHA